MAIVKMKKFTLLAFESQKEQLLEKIQSFSDAEFINLQDESMLENNEELKELRKDEPDEDLAKCEDELSKVKFALQFLENYVPKKSLIQSLRQEIPSYTIDELKDKVLSSNWEQVCQKMKEKEEKLSKIENEKTRLQTAVISLKPYEKFDAPFESLNGFKHTVAFLGSMANQYSDTLEEIFKQNDDSYLEIISKDNQDTYFFALCNKYDSDSIEESLRGCGFTPFKTNEEERPLKLIQDYNEKVSLLDSDKFLLKEELAGYEEELKVLELAYEYFNNLAKRKFVSNKFLKTKKTVMIQGWIPDENSKKFEGIISTIAGEDYYLNLEDVKDEEIDDVPIKLKNNSLNTAFESVTEMYSLPKYNDIDPTPVVTPFYLAFFGMMVADMGYGIVMFVALTLAMKFFNFNDGTKKMLKFFRYLSIPCFIFGLIYGSFFGDIIKFPNLIDTNTDVMTILVLSVVFGLIQIFFGLGMKAYILIKVHHQYLYAFYDVGSWVLALVGLMGYGASFVLNVSPAIKNISIAMAIFGSIVIILTQGREMKSKPAQLAQGLYSLYGITSYVSDLVSYTRLMAIGLSGASIAGAMNMIMKMIPGVGFIILGPLIFVIGHTINLLLSLLSGYVHTLRLTYVEYFSKFYDGGGRPFEPFKTENKYINLKRD
ncbi:V-type ATP synthase subunit I [Clostridium sp. BJN0001]|uniref:V-type ATP synthase subunit I n=1 Tax=Clostridium sp. BJN0001 TaxID=2930219 RepID=UPI001FD4BE69|nr:V-type ATP synthase subunit I [Clostridium sp. BJN0001]